MKRDFSFKAAPTFKSTRRFDPKSYATYVVKYTDGYYNAKYSYGYTDVTYERDSRNDYAGEKYYITGTKDTYGNLTGYKWATSPYMTDVYYYYRTAYGYVQKHYSYLHGYSYYKVSYNYIGKTGSYNTYSSYKYYNTVYYYNVKYSYLTGYGYKKTPIIKYYSVSQPYYRN